MSGVVASILFYCKNKQNTNLGLCAHVWNLQLESFKHPHFYSFMAFPEYPIDPTRRNEFLFPIPMWVCVIMEMGLLRLAWIAGTLPIVFVSLPFSCLTYFRTTLLGFAGRGKILQSSSHKHTVPQRFFCHFYAVAVVWTTLLLFSTWMYAYQMAPPVSGPLLFSTIASHLTGGSNISLHETQDRQRVWRSVFLLLLMEIQVIRRLIETIYVFSYSPSARMHIFGYLTGLFFYTAAPLSFCSMYASEVLKFVADKVVEFIVKGKSQMPTPEIDIWEFVRPLLKLGWQAWIGAAIFFWGWIHQQRCHAILGSLRGNGEQSDKYVIPHGDWFDLVSAPHYLAEMIIYAGIAIAGGWDLTIWLLLGFVVANLVFAAAETHRWYLQKFDDYPSKRRAIIPFMF